MSTILYPCLFEIVSMLTNVDEPVPRLLLIRRCTGLRTISKVQAKGPPNAFLAQIPS
jgi:hypothetical protein